MNVVLFRDLVQERWASIEVYADRLISGLQQLNVPDWLFISACPRGLRSSRFTVPALYFSRTFIYSPYAWLHQGDINHVLDNSYGHLLHFIDPRRTIVTSHGGTPITWRRWNREGPAMRFFDWAFSGTLKAARIISVSQYSKRELVENFDYDPTHVHVVYHGVDEKYRVLNANIRESVRAKYLQPGEMGLILHVGHCAARKNVEGLLHAFALLLKRFVRPYRLLQVGGQFSRDQRQLLDQLGCMERVTQIPQMPSDQLVSLYNAADVFVFPSLYEGFGIPLIEAMACGTPIVCSDFELFHEVCADAALFAESRDDNALAAAIARALNDHTYAAYLAARGLERAKMFSWERTALETLAVYQQIA